MQLNRKVVVITGASSGIGEATARQLSEAGAAVALVARRMDRIEKLATELTDKGGQALALEADVSDRAAMQAIAQTTVAKLGKVDCLVNNAGQMLLSEFERQPFSEWERMISVNLLGAMYATEAFLPSLVDGGGDIVNISSVAGRKARPTSGVYSATKWGLNGWSEALRQELQTKGIRVLVVEPGAVHTELVDHISIDELRAQAQQYYEDLEALTAQDISSVITFALSMPSRASINEVLIRPTKQAY